MTIAVSITSPRSTEGDVAVDILSDVRSVNSVTPGVKSDSCTVHRSPPTESLNRPAAATFSLRVQRSSAVLPVTGPLHYQALTH